MNVQYKKYDNAVGGSDDSTDPNPSRNPNDYLVPRVDGKTGFGFLLLIGIYLIAIVLIFKPTKFYIYE